MGGLLKMWLQHTVAIEPYEGRNGAGKDTFGPPENLPGWLEQKIVNVRAKDGSVTVSTAQFHCDLGPDVPPRSRGTFPDGTDSRVIKTGPLPAGALKMLPEHLVIWFE